MSGDFSALDKEPDGVCWKLSAPGCAPLRLANGLTAYSVKAMVETAYQSGRVSAFAELRALIGEWLRTVPGG